MKKNTEENDFMIIGPFYYDFLKTIAKISSASSFTGLFFGTALFLSKIVDGYGIAFKLAAVFFIYFFLFTFIIMLPFELFSTRKILSKIDAKGILVIQQYLLRKKRTRFIAWENIKAVEIKYDSENPSDEPYNFFLLLDYDKKDSFKKLTHKKHQEELLAAIQKFAPQLRIDNDEKKPLALP